MNRARKPAKPVGAGKACPACGAQMRRFKHPNGWRPRPSQPFYFSYWDVCTCGRLQHYEEAKVRLGSPCVTEHGLNAQQGRALAAVMDRNLGKPLTDCRRWIAERLGIEERFAIFSELDATECKTVMTICAEEN